VERFEIFGSSVCPVSGSIVSRGLSGDHSGITSMFGQIFIVLEVTFVRRGSIIIFFVVVRLFAGTFVVVVVVVLLLLLLLLCFICMFFYFARDLCKRSWTDGFGRTVDR
jgi:hypothetical protein